jgi:carboxypeptidase C (cathepsin A)
MLAALVLVSSLLSFSAAQRQNPLMNNLPTGHVMSKINPTSANLTQVEKLRLDSLSSTDFMTLSHPAHPAHQIRVKRTDGFCDNTVKSYAGYLDADYGTKHLFFWFFESRSNPDEDDVLMWINGGPGRKFNVPRSHCADLPWGRGFIVHGPLH